MSTNNNDTLLSVYKILGINNVKRFNNRFMIKEQSVSEHTHNALILGKLLLDDQTYFRYLKQSNYNFNKIVFYECLMFHDVPEVFTGDILYDFKRYLATNIDFDSVEEEFIKKSIMTDTELSNIIQTWIKEYYMATDNRLFKKEMDLLKFCDMLELSIYCSKEYSFGNKFVLHILDTSIKIIESFKEIIENNDLALSLYLDLKRSFPFEESNLIESLRRKDGLHTNG